MNRRSTTIVIAYLCLFSAGLAIAKEPQAPAAGKSDSLVVQGQFEVSLNDKGYSWQKVQEAEKDGVTASYYLATKEGSTAKLVLIRLSSKLEADQARLTHCKANVNAVGQMLAKQGFGSFKMTPAAPPKPPIADRVVTNVTGKTAEGKTTAASIVAVFGKATYTFQIICDTEAEAATLAKATESLKES